jgi:hypothetical protein
MTLSLTCSCGARLEIDDKFAGQTISCPDCKQSLQAPAINQTAVRTSGFAVASFVLALVGAFTIVGTLVAIGLGAFALVDIKRHRDRLAGSGYAVSGIVLGVILTGLSLFAYVSVELFGLDGLMREPQWAGKLDYSGSLEIVRSREGFAITRPSEKWGQYRDPQQQLGAMSREELLLVNVAEDGYIVCWPRPVPAQSSLERCREKALEDFRNADLISGSDRISPKLRASVFEVHPAKHLPTVGETQSVEMIVDKTLGGQRRTFLLRVVRKQGDDQMYLVAGGTARHRFSRLEPQLRKGLDSFRVLNRNWP